MPVVQGVMVRLAPATGLYRLHTLNSYSKAAARCRLASSLHNSNTCTCLSCRDVGRSGKGATLANRLAARKAADAAQQAAASPVAGSTVAPGLADQLSLRQQQGSGSHPQADAALTWWFASGFDASELLLKFSPRPVSAAAAAPADRKASRGSRRATRDAAAGRRSPPPAPLRYVFPRNARLVWPRVAVLELA